MIETEHFIEFFLRQDKHDFRDLYEKDLRKLFKDLKPLNARSLYEKAQILGVSLNEN
jgi:DNA-directed RNA polymerase